MAASADNKENDKDAIDLPKSLTTEQSQEESIRAASLLGSKHKNMSSLIERPMLQFIDHDRILAEQQMIIAYSNDRSSTVLDAVLQSMQRNRKILEKKALKFQKNHSADQAEECNKRIKIIDSTLAKLERETNSIYRSIQPSEDGLYIEENRSISGSGQIFIEQRLLRQKGGINKFFDETGRAIHVKHMLKEKFTKPDTYGLLTFDGQHSSMLKRTRPVVQGFTSGLDTKPSHLDVDIKELRFEDHPLMSEEEYNCAILENYVTQLESTSGEDHAFYYMQKIQALRAELDDLREGCAKHLKSQSSSMPSINYNDDRMSCKRKMSNIRTEIMDLTEMVESINEGRFRLLNEIVDQWNKIQSIRRKQGFVTCKHRLVFENDKRTLIQDLSDKDIMAEVRERIEEHEWKFELELLHHEKKVEAINARPPTPTEIVLSDLLQRSATKPIHIPLDEKQLRIQIRKRKRRSQWPDEEPFYRPFLLHDGKMTMDVELPEYERIRRRSILKSEYYIQLWVNDQMVTSTEVRPLQLDFSIQFAEIISVSVLKRPKNLIIKVFKKGFIWDHEIAKMFIAVPELDSSRLNSIHPEYADGASNSASSTQRIQFTGENCHTATWQRDNQPSIIEKIRNFLCRRTDMTALHHTGGHILYDTVWLGSSDGAASITNTNWTNSKNGSLYVGSSSAKDLLSIQRASQWMTANRVDPNDPQNTGLLSLLELFDNETISDTGFYPAVQDNSLLFESSNIAYRRRLYLLRKRYEYREKVRFKVPLPDEAVTLKMIRHFERMVENSLKSDSLGEYVRNIRALLDDDDGGDGGQNKLERPHNRNDKAKIVKKIVDTSKYVREIPQPELNGIQWIKNFFASHRPLNPIRKERSVHSASTITKCRIIVQVIRGYHIPVRKHKTENDSYRNFRATLLRGAEIGGIQKVFARDAGMDSFPDADDTFRKQDRSDDASYIQDGGSSSLFRTQIDSHDPERTRVNAQLQADEEMRQRLKERVFSFLSVTFQGQNKRTRAIEGPFPQFNETIELDFKAPNDDFSPDSVKFVDQQLYFDLFDEITVDTLKNDSDLYLLNQRNENRWLGSISVPFSTLYENGKIVGTFILKTPPVYLAYEKPSEPNLSSLTMVMTLDPILPQPDRIENIISSGESPQDFHRANAWVKFVQKKVPERKILALAPNNHGKATLIMRFIRAQDPPAQLDSVSKCLRFVSLIPYVSDTLAFDSGDVWVDTQTFLDTLAGDSEEHAILLCNFLKHLKKKAWVVLGKGVPEGDTAYVLTLENDGYKFWNPMTAQTFRLRDHQSVCPLTEVHLIFDETNIWANIQRETNPFKVNFDNFEHSPQNWLPFYAPETGILSMVTGLFKRQQDSLQQQKRRDPLQSIQSSKLNYEEIPMEVAERLSTDIENRIKMSFIEWRRRHTQFHSHVGSQLSKVLREFEVAKQNGVSFQEDKHGNMLRDIQESFTLIGFPLNFTFTDMKSILEEIHNTMIHELQEEKIEFALGVYVHPYVNNVFSVWIYLTGLLERF